MTAYGQAAMESCATDCSTAEIEMFDHAFAPASAGAIRVYLPRDHN